MAKKANEKSLIALKKWQDEHRDPKTGKVVVKRKSPEELIKIKKAALDKLMVKVNQLKEEIAKIDQRANKKQIAELTKGFTAEDLAKAIALLKANS